MTRSGLLGALLLGCMAAGTPAHSWAAADETSTRFSAGDQPYWVEQVVEGLNLPSAMVWLPNGEMLVTERKGGLRVIRNDRLDPKPVSGVPELYKSVYDGLKDIAVDPDFSTNGTLYLLLSEGTFEAHHAAVYRARYSGDSLQGVKRIFRSSEGVGGAVITITTRLIFLADKTLLFGVAEDHAQARAQKLNSHMGKMLRINRDGSIPADNPFVNTPDALPEIWTYGHRVVLGLYQDLDSGTVWQIESGPRGGDELNVLKAGANYGWAKTSWGFAYNNQGLEAPLQSAPGIEEPILVWMMPSATPSGLTRYRGQAYALWDGDYFVGHLSGKGISRLRIEDRRVVLQERMLLDLDERIRDIKAGPDGRIYALTDHPNGRVLRLQPGRPRGSQLARVANKLTQPYKLTDVVNFPTGGEEKIADLSPDDMAQGRQAFLERCSGCHSVGTAVQGGPIGPDLAGAYGHLMGRKSGFDYSPIMAGGLLVWNFAILDRFLADPNSLLPGTRMAAPPVIEADVRRNIIGFLKQHSSR